MKKKITISNGNIKVNKCVEGEKIETMIDRIVYGNEPLEDGSDVIYTLAKDGVNPAHDHRTDKYVVMLDEAEKTNRTISNDAFMKAVKGGKSEENSEENNKKSDGAESIQGKSQGDTK